MYTPPVFAVSDTQRLHGLIREYPLATMITLDVSGIVVNHVPFLLDTTRGEQGVLMGHVARANPVWQSFSREIPSVVVFEGPQAYVTPSWYAAKAEHGKVVPTWNYAVVHVRGFPRVVKEESAVLALLDRLTRAQEAALPSPWQLQDAPADYIEKLMSAIVGIEIPVSSIEGKWKMSQNRDAADRAGVCNGLRELGGDAAATMARWMEDLF